jgi:hypothetical protein
MTIATVRDRTFRGSAVQPFMFFMNANMNTRAEIYAVDLYVLLQREFRRRQSRECSSCYVQLPYRIDRQDPNSANWEIILPKPCPQGCQALMDELATEFAMLYDLRADPGPRNA